MSRVLEWPLVDAHPATIHHTASMIVFFFFLSSLLEVYKHDPLLTFLGCVFWAEDKIWTLVQHNNTELTHVRGANAEKPYSMTLDYGGSLEQLEAVIDGSEHCEQEVAYHCKRSRLLNTPGKNYSCPGPFVKAMQDDCIVAVGP